MTNRLIIVALLFAFIASDADAQNRYRRRGVILGGLAGAAIGAAIGDKGNNETAGALVGGAVGAIAGGKIGSQKDQRIDHNHRYHSGHGQSGHYYTTPQYTTPQYTTPQQHHGHHGYHQVQPAYPVYRQPVYPQPVPAVTTADVIQMQRRGLSETTMIRLIQTHGVAAKPSVSEVIDMHEFGVSERVIATMQGDMVSTDYYGPTLAAPLN